MKAKELTTTNPDGLRASKAAMFVQVAGKFSSQILVEKGNKKINAKSIMGVLSLGVKQGEQIYIFANGKDEEKAIEALEELVEKSFE
jgi:phosphotransferase system HPr (HPr) family protein